MKIISNNTVELTKVEQHVQTTFNLLLDQGHGIPQSVARIKELHPGMDPAFYRWLGDEPLMPDPPRPKPYEGPFDPPPAEYMEGAIAWRFTKVSVPGEDRWEPTGWEIIKADGILTVDMDSRLPIRDSIIYAP